MKAPNLCPMCGESDGWKLIDTTKKGFNAKHAVIGGVFLGGIGLAAVFPVSKKLHINALNADFLTNTTVV